MSVFYWYFLSNLHELWVKNHKIVNIYKKYVCSPYGTYLNSRFTYLYPNIKKPKDFLHLKPKHVIVDLIVAGTVFRDVILQSRTGQLQVGLADGAQVNFGSADH